MAAVRRSFFQRGNCGLLARAERSSTYLFQPSPSPIFSLSSFALPLQFESRRLYRKEKQRKRDEEGRASDAQQQKLGQGNQLNEVGEDDESVTPEEMEILKELYRVTQTEGTVKSLFGDSRWELSEEDKQQAVDATKRWVQEAVVGLKLCPFIKPDEIRYLVSSARYTPQFEEDVKAEKQYLINHPEVLVIETLSKVLITNRYQHLWSLQRRYTHFKAFIFGIAW